MKKILMIFDLDGTLWKVNSHVNIVDSYLKYPFFSSLIGKILYKFNSELYMKLLNKKFNEIPKSYIHNYMPPLRNNIVSILQNNIDKSIIITNAPELIAKRANEIFNVPVYTAPIGGKMKILKKLKYEWDYLIVYTDNITDVDLISNADYAYVITTQKNKADFDKYNDKNIIEYDFNY